MTHKTLQRKFQNFQNIAAWLPEATRKRGYAKLLHEEAHMMCDDAYKDLHRLYMLHEIIVRRQYLLAHQDEIGRIEFSQYWQTLNRQEEKLL